MSYRYMPAAWDTKIRELVVAQGWEEGERRVGNAALKLLLICVTEHTNDESGKFWPAVETMCDETELDVRTVRAGLRKLERIGLIETVEPPRQHRATVRGVGGGVAGRRERAS